MKVSIRTRCCQVNCRHQPDVWVVDLPSPEDFKDLEEFEIVCATGTCEKCGARQMWPMLSEIKK